VDPVRLPVAFQSAAAVLASALHSDVGKLLNPHHSCTAGLMYEVRMVTGVDRPVPRALSSQALLRRGHDDELAPLKRPMENIDRDAAHRCQRKRARARVSDSHTQMPIPLGPDASANRNTAGPPAILSVSGTPSILDWLSLSASVSRL